MNFKIWLSKQGKGVAGARYRNKERKGIVKAGYGSKDFHFRKKLIKTHPLTNF